MQLVVNALLVYSDTMLTWRIPEEPPPTKKKGDYFQVYICSQSFSKKNYKRQNKSSGYLGKAGFRGQG